MHQLSPFLTSHNDSLLIRFLALSLSLSLPLVP